MDGKIALDWGSNSSAVSTTEESVSAGFKFEGYNVYQLPGSGSPLTEGVKVATYDKVNLIQNILDPTVDPLTGLVVDAAKQTGTDSGIQRHFETDYDEYAASHVQWDILLFCGDCIQLSTRQRWQSL